MAYMKAFAQGLSDLIGWDGDPNNDETMELGHALLQLTRCKFKLTPTGITFIPVANPKRKRGSSKQMTLSEACNCLYIAARDGRVETKHGLLVCKKAVAVVQGRLGVRPRRVVKKSYFLNGTPIKAVDFNRLAVDN